MVGKEYMAPSVNVHVTPSSVLKKSVTMWAFLLHTHHVSQHCFSTVCMAVMVPVLG